MLAYLYRRHVIRVEAEQNLDTLSWEAKGVIEPIEGGTSHTFSASGAIHPFKTEVEAKHVKTEVEAKHAFLQQAKRWIYDHVGS
jgi:hypothetical protein